MWWCGIFYDFHVRMKAAKLLLQNSINRFSLCRAVRRVIKIASRLLRQIAFCSQNGGEKRHKWKLFNVLPKKQKLPASGDWDPCGRPSVSPVGDNWFVAPAVWSGCQKHKKTDVRCFGQTLKKVTHIDCIWITFRSFDKTLTHPCLNHRNDVFPSHPIILVYLQRMGKEGQTHLLLFIYYDCKGQKRNKKIREWGWEME